MDNHIQDYKKYALLITGYEDLFLLNLYRTFRPDIVEEKQRTNQQNKAMHKYFEQVAEALNEAGISRVEYAELVKSRGIELSWSKENVKEDMWKLIQNALLKKASTKELAKIEVDSIYDEMNNFLGSKFGVHVEFPSEESLSEKCRVEG